MPDTSTVVVIPTNKATVFLVRQPGQSVTYSNLIGAYSVLAALTYGGIQSLGPTNAELVVLPTNKATFSFAKERTLATYLSIAASWGTLYSSITGLSYGQVGVVP